MGGRVENRLWALLVGSVFLIGFSTWRIQSSFDWRYPPPTSLVVTDQYAGDLGALFLGAHRLAGDLAYIQFLQYYGEEDSESEPLPHYKVESGAGHFPRAKEFGARLIHLDPFFNAAILEIGGALAFNVERAGEALDLLAEAVRQDPSYYRYRLYIAAILYKNQKQDDRLIDLLEQAIRERDCPVLLKLVFGNLLKKNGQYLRAAYVYRYVMETALAEGDRATAENHLKELVQEHREARASLEGPGRY